MPTTSVEKLSSTRAKLTITVTPEELKPSIVHAYEHIAEQVVIPGFRKGKVPPQIINQRVGKPAVLEHAINEGLESFYREAVLSKEIKAIGRPNAEIVDAPDPQTFDGDLKFTVEVDVRPEIKLPKYSTIELSVDDASASAEDIQSELDAMRARFGTLSTVDRAAKTGDFVTLDLSARIDGKEVDNASGLSYEIGSGELLEGLDEAIDTLTAGESTTFKSKLIGGDHAGEEAEVSVTVKAVKERELPEADDDFAQMASEFETLAELKVDLRARVEQRSVFDQVNQAREQLITKLIEKTEIPLAEDVIEEEVKRHLENEGLQQDDPHRAEARAEAEKNFRTQVLIDTVVDEEGVKASNNDLSQYIFQLANQYGMSPDDFVKAITENGQIGSVVADVTRNRAIAYLLGQVKIKDSKGKTVDVSNFTTTAFDSDEPASETV